MALVTISGVGVLAGYITMPIDGVWTGDLVIDQPDGSGFDAGTKVKIESQGFELNGAVAPKRTGDFLDAVHVRVLGGAGGMALQAQQRGFAQPGAYVRDVLQSLADNGGETLSDTVDEGLLSTNLVAWAILQMPVSQALIALLDIVAPTNHWRFLPDGSLWTGQESWDASSVVFDVLNFNPTDGTYDLGVEAPSIVPGVALDGVGQVNRVEHKIEAGKIRSHVWTTLAEGGDRSMKAAIYQVVGQYVAGIDYLALYDAKVMAQSADLTTVDLQPADPRLPGLGRVPLRHGLPGCKVQISNGSILRLGWDRGNASMPYAALWNGGETVQRIQIAGNTDAARKGDPIKIDTPGLMATWMSQVEVAVNAISSGAVDPLSSTFIDLPGIEIKSGSSLVGLG